MRSPQVVIGDPLLSGLPMSGGRTGVKPLHVRTTGGPPQITLGGLNLSGGTNGGPSSTGGTIGDFNVSNLRIT
jgi:hypothetical protein